MIDGLFRLIKSNEEPICVERYKVGTINKKDLIMSNKWSTTKSDTKKYSVILYYDPSIESLPKDITDLATTYNVTIVHSDNIYTLLRSYNDFLNNIDEQLRILKNEPIAKCHIISKYVFRTSNPMIFGVEVLEGSIKIADKVYSSESIDNFIGTIESIQNDNNNVTKADETQEVCIKVNTKKIIGKDITTDAILWLR